MQCISSLGCSVRFEPGLEGDALCVDLRGRIDTDLDTKYFVVSGKHPLRGCKASRRQSVLCFLAQYLFEIILYLVGLFDPHVRSGRVVFGDGVTLYLIEPDAVMTDGGNFDVDSV